MKLDKYHQHEALDRAHVVREIIYSHLGETYVIDTYKSDKYGRLLAVIQLPLSDSLNILLIKNGFAKEYLG